MKVFTLFKYLRDCSVKTELVCRKIMRKLVSIVSKIGCIVNRQFTLSFALELTSGQWSRSTENRTYALSKFQQHLVRDMIPNSLWTVLFQRIPFLFGTRANERPLSFSKSSCIQRYESSVCQTFLFIVSCSTGNVVEHRHE